MGENAKRKSDGQTVKIGTLENLYYLRHDQRWEVSPLEGNVNPHGPEESELRFRFPFPDEDHIAPGEFIDHAKGHRLPWTVPADWQGHSTVQFKHANGYLVSLPCPESVPEGAPVVQTMSGEPIQVHRNGYGGAVELVQQKNVPGDGGLVSVVACKGCGAKWRVPASEAVSIAQALCERAERDQLEHERAMRRAGYAEYQLGTSSSATYDREIARRMLDGYGLAYLLDDQEVPA